MPEMRIDSTCTYKLTAGETSVDLYHFALLDTSNEGQVVNPDNDAPATSDVPAGVLVDIDANEDDLDAGEYGTFAFEGDVKVTASASVSIGDKCVIGKTTGRVRPLAPATDTSGIFIVGIAQSAASANGDQIILRLTPGKQFHS